MTNERNSYIKYDNTLKQEAIDTAFNKKTETNHKYKDYPEL